MMTNVHCFLVFVAQVFPVLGARGAREAVHGLHGLYQQAAVPVIHLDPGKATVDDYLRMFPEKFLASNKRIKPIDVRKIEHEDFIDYEIEFVELSQDDSVDEARPEEFIFKQTDESDSFLDNLNSKVSSDKDQNYSLSEDSKEVNLVNYDLSRKNIKSINPRTRGGDIRRRRRIKLKRDPARTNSRPREINDASNQIDTSQQSKRVENNFSHSFFSKPRTVLRNLIQIPETERKATLLDRRTLHSGQTPTHHRPTNFRSRKRIPHKFGRSFSHDDKPADQLIRLRNPAIITKLERSNNIERNIIKSIDKSRDNLNDKPSEAEEDLVEHVTSQRQNTFPILTETTDSGIQGVPNKSTSSHNNNPVTESDIDMNKPGEGPEIKPQSKLITEERLSLLPPSLQTLDEAKTSAAETLEGDVDLTEDISTLDEREKSPSLSETIVPLRLTTTTSVQTATTTTTMTSERTTTPLMMYPDVFTQQPDIVQTLQPRTNSLPFHLLSVFGSKPRSSRLQIAQNRNQNPSPEINVSWSESVSRHSQSEIKPEIVSVFSNMQQITTVSSAFQFSIISTSTETSAPLYPSTTPTQNVSDHPLKLHKIEQLLPSQSAAKTAATKSTTFSLPARSSTLRATVISTTTTKTTSTTTSTITTTELTSDTTATNLVADLTSHSTFKTLLKTELFEGITTQAGVESIMDDNQMMTTPIPEDLQLSESITSVYLHNSSMLPSFTNNIKTTETPKIDTVNSITLLPFSKLTNQILDSDRKDSRTDIRQQQEAANNASDENVYTVTPVSVTLIPTTETEMHYNDDDDGVTDVTDTNDDQRDIIQTTTLDPMTEMYSGHYHEENPGQYHEVNPGQYHEVNPGQYHEVNPGQYHEVNPGQYIGDEGKYQSVKYQNLESTYPGGYEVNEVKVDFDNRDEHKIYNVQAKAGDFIIGEVGKIDVNNGQTVEGVRYTALDGEVDPLKIAEILNRYFGTRTS